MPVFAQSCRRAPTAAPVRDQDQVTENIRRVRPLLDDTEDTPLDVSTLQGAIEEAQRTRALQTANADKFLSSIGTSGRHKFAGQNLSVKKGQDTINGYITEAGLFKPWNNVDFMLKTSGKYGCPVVSTPSIKALPTGFEIPTDNTKSYIGAPLIQAAKSAASNEPAVFVGSDMIGNVPGIWDTSEKTLPACGNEGVNVQVVYPGKATGSTYVGTYNIGTADYTGYEQQTDMVSNVTYETCMARAEDKGAALFAFTGNRCYLNQKSVEDAKSNGIGIELNPRTTGGVWTTAGQKMVHFGMDGTLNILNTETPSKVPSNILHKIGLAEGLPACDFAKGGAILTATGTWGKNCNSVLGTKKETKFIGTYDGGIFGNLLKNSMIAREKNATNIRETVKYEYYTWAPPGVFCNQLYPRCGENVNNSFDEWRAAGGSCPSGFSERSDCSTGCASKDIFGYSHCA